MLRGDIDDVGSTHDPLSLRPLTFLRHGTPVQTMGLFELYPKHSRWLLLHLKQVGRLRSHLTRRRAHVQHGLDADDAEANSSEGNMAACVIV